MKNLKLELSLFVGGVFAFALMMSSVGCGSRDRSAPTSMTGIKEVIAEVNTGLDGLTNEQRNIKDRLKADNTPGAVKHLYVQSAMSGDILMYSTVKGKVTSSGKRLSPTTVEEAYYGDTIGDYRKGNFFRLPGGRSAYTREMLQDDGTYGSSIEYLYWWDVKGAYFQMYIGAGQLVVISDQPLPVKKAKITLEKMDDK
jgi:hypothetical protein